MELKKTLLEQALELPIEDREALAEALFASLDEPMPPAIAATWQTELLRRREEARRDPSLLLDGDPVFDALFAEFGATRPG